ncbi:hypothetical protein OSTOST_21501 [Ostertagia ostertagi]
MIARTLPPTTVAPHPSLRAPASTISRYFMDDIRSNEYLPYQTKGADMKRKQFYAWAGKRSDPEKRKQFYAWAGK